MEEVGEAMINMEVEATTKEEEVVDNTPQMDLFQRAQLNNPEPVIECKSQSLMNLRELRSMTLN